MLHRYQLEVTTRCNFDCWYCTGRQMVQRDMDWDTFTKIVDSIPAGATVMLQGEGEPTLWPHWWRGVEYAVQRGLVPYSIINGSRVDVPQTDKLFPRIGVSLDTVDAAEASAIGRHNVTKVLANIELLHAAMPGRLTIYITHVARDTKPLIRWLMQRELRYVIQPLQAKTDYQVVYPQGMTRPQSVAVKRSCRLIDTHHYFTADGTELPCCYIKRDWQTFKLEEAKAQLANGLVPRHCQGCSQLR